MRRFFRGIARGFTASLFATVWCAVVLLGVAVLWVIQIACVIQNKPRPLDAFLDVMDDVLRAIKFER